MEKLLVDDSDMGPFDALAGIAASPPMLPGYHGPVGVTDGEGGAHEGVPACRALGAVPLRIEAESWAGRLA